MACVMCTMKNITRVHKQKIYLPNSKFRIVNDIVCHSKLMSIILRRAQRHNLTDNTVLRFKYATVLLRHIRQNGHYKRIGWLGLSQTLSQTNHSLHIVTIASQEGHIGSLRDTHSFGCCFWCHLGIQRKRKKQDFL